MIRCGAMPELSAPISELISGKCAEIDEIIGQIEELKRSDEDVEDEIAALEEVRLVIEQCVNFLRAIVSLRNDGYSQSRFHAAVRFNIGHYAAQRRLMAGATSRDGTYLYGEEDACECEVMNELLSEFLM